MASNRVLIRVDDCKGCGLCIDACPVNVLGFAEELNAMGYRPARYTGEGCTACGTCFYTCPEPMAITVIRNVEDLDERFCPVCKQTVKCIPDYRSGPERICIECLSPCNSENV
ncbi:MAG: 4Fe-4S dicluster domain-containing protein [FCB group bacterium]|nr:4Fe-4S dicluster domain-containing protein [FCB group bacterium]